MSIISHLQPRGFERAALWWLLCGDDIKFGIKALVSVRQQRHSKTHPHRARDSVGIVKCCLILLKNGHGQLSVSIHWIRNRGCFFWLLQMKAGPKSATLCQSWSASFRADTCCPMHRLLPLSAVDFRVSTKPGK